MMEEEIITFLVGWQFKKLIHDKGIQIKSTNKKAQIK